MFLFNWWQSTLPAAAATVTGKDVIVELELVLAQRNQRSESAYDKTELSHWFKLQLDRVLSTSGRENKIALTRHIFARLCSNEGRAFMRDHAMFARVIFYKLHELVGQGLTLDWEYHILFPLAKEQPLGSPTPLWRSEFLKAF